MVLVTLLNPAEGGTAQKAVFNRVYVFLIRFAQRITNMARKALIAKAKKPAKFKSRVVRRCFQCGRPRGYMRDFDLCRVCFRELALEGNIPGIKKSSW